MSTRKVRYTRGYMHQKYTVSPAQSLRRKRSRRRAKERRLERKNGIKRRAKSLGMYFITMLQAFLSFQRERDLKNKLWSRTRKI